MGAPWFRCMGAPRLRPPVAHMDVWPAFPSCGLFDSEGNSLSYWVRNLNELILLDDAVLRV